MSPERAVEVWKPLYLHFTTVYDVFHNSSKVKITNQEYETKSKQLIKFSKVFNKDLDGSLFLIANYIENNFSVPFEITKDDLDIFISWKGRRESISYKFSSELQFVLDNFSNKDFSTKYAHDSDLFKSYLSGKISHETLVLLDKYFIPFLADWNNKDSMNLFSDKVFRLIKYRPFVRHDKDKITEIIGRLNNTDINTCI